MTYEEFASEWDNNSEIKCNTSGSTGTPKTISLPKSEMEKSAWRTAEFFNLNSDSTLYSCISPDYIGGKMMLVRQRILNCRLLWETPSNRPLLNFKGGKISLLSVVSSQMEYILYNLRTLPEIENILIGGSAIPAALREKIALSGLNAFESYGMTETSSHIAIRKIEKSPTPFKTLGDITVDKINEALRIHIPGWQTLVTNDCALVKSPTEFQILGRLDNVIISGGIKINPEIVEQKLSKYIETPFFIKSISDDKWGQILILVAQGDESQREDMKKACECIEPKYHRPKNILLVKEIRRSANGKILRNYDYGLENV